MTTRKIADGYELEALPISADTAISIRITSEGLIILKFEIREIAGVWVTTEREGSYSHSSSTLEDEMAHLLKRVTKWVDSHKKNREAVRKVLRNWEVGAIK